MNKIVMKMNDQNININPIPMPPPVENTLMQLQASNFHHHNNNHSVPPPGNGVNTIPNNNQVHHPSSVINLTNSSDVVIGPMTQYQGAVTIYQYMDATVQRATSNNGHPHVGFHNRQGNTGDSNNCCPGIDFRNIQTWLLLIIIVLIAIGVGVGIHLTLLDQKNDKNVSRPERHHILFGNEYEDDTIPNLGNGHLIIDRKQWGSIIISDEDPKNIKLVHPIPYVLISHIGVQSNPCDNVYNCSIKMRTLQDAFIAEKKQIDLPANFYVSNDGYIYVGRGWNIANSYINSTLAISFMGDYNRYIPSDRQIEGVQYLISYGIARKFIANDYKLIALNQTRTTKSPGSYVYRIITKWPRWYPCGVGNNTKCDLV